MPRSVSAQLRRAPGTGPGSTARGLYGSTAGANLARAGTAEVIGTFVLVLAGTAAAVASSSRDPKPYDLLTVVLAFGLALAALAAALGHVSGAHLNPAVTLGLAATRRFPARAVPVYLACQLLGAVLASLTTWAFYGDEGRTQSRLAATLPAEGVGSGRAFFVEAVITFVLVLVVISVATDDRAPSASAPLAVGAALAVCVAIAAPVTGGAVNPARAFGPMVVAGVWQDAWLYLVAPVVGGVLAAVVYDRVLAPAEAPETA
nr:MIP family channel protein [Kineococcus siccus]